MTLTELPAIATYNVSRLERRAAEVVERHFGTECPDPPVDIEAILEALSGVRFDIYPGLKARWAMEGMVYRRDGELLVLIDGDLADHPASGRYRFTVAEELGHVILHANVCEAIRTPDQAAALMGSHVYDDMDHNARRFAAAVLMPPLALDRAARAIFPNALEIHGPKDPAAVTGTIADALARQFQVSRQSMRIRMQQWPSRLADRIHRAIAAGRTQLPSTQ